MIANHCPTSIDIWNESQKLLKEGFANKALTIQASKELESVCIDSVAKFAKLYVSDHMESFRNSVSSAKVSVSDSEKTIMSLGARWAMIDDRIVSIFVDSGHAKKFKMIDLLDDLSEMYGTRLSSLVSSIWQNASDGRDNIRYFESEIPEFIAKCEKISFDLIQDLSELRH